MDVFPQFQRESFRKTVRDGSERERERDEERGGERESEIQRGETKRYKHYKVEMKRGEASGGKDETD